MSTKYAYVCSERQTMLVKFHYNQFWSFIMFLMPIRRRTSNDKRFEKCSYRASVIFALVAIYAICFTLNHHDLETKYESRIIKTLVHYNLIINVVLMNTILLTGVFRGQLLVDVKFDLNETNNFINTCEKNKELLSKADEELSKKILLSATGISYTSPV